MADDPFYQRAHCCTWERRSRNNQSRWSAVTIEMAASIEMECF
jgi:hypothetical protein